MATDNPVLTRVITELKEATLNLTDTDYYDILLLGQALNQQDNGRVISYFGAHRNGLDEVFESYSLALGKNNVTLTITGNYRDNSEKNITAHPKYWQDGTANLDDYG